MSNYVLGIHPQSFCDLIGGTFKKELEITEGMHYFACNDKKAFLTSTDHRGYKFRSFQNVCDTLSYLLNKVYIIFGNKLYKKLVVFRCLQIVPLL